jgi:cell filamentation protein
MKYAIGTEEDEFEPGSDRKVLKNMLSITSELDMQDAESSLLLGLYEFIYEPEFNVNSISFSDIMTWHRKWLGNVYSWAGLFRSVNMGKGGFEFAAAKFVPALVKKYEQDFLISYLKLTELEREELISYLAKSHVEFILIHPFREGNGRLSRLLLDVMATHAGYGPLDYSVWDANKDYYFKSIQAGHAGDYHHIERLVRDVLED